MKHIALAWVSLACAVAACGQAVVESAIITGAAAGGTAAGARSTGAAAASVFGRLNEIVSKSGAATGSSASEKSAAPAVPEKPASPAEPAAPSIAAARVRAVPAPKLAPQAIDASLVTAGMTREDLIACCGEPSMRTTGMKKSKSLETMWYTTSDKDELKVQLEDGVVTSAVSSKTSRASRK